MAQQNIPKLQTTIGSLGQFAPGQRKAVLPPVPKSNPLMELGQVLGVTQKLTTQYASLKQQEQRRQQEIDKAVALNEKQRAELQQKIAIEQAEAVQNENIIKEIKDLQENKTDWSYLKDYNQDRSFRDALVKRHIVNNLVPNLQAKASSLINPEVYRTRDQFQNAVAEAFDNEWKSFVDEVGEEAANTVTSKAMWARSTDPIRTKMLLDFDKARDDFIINEVIVNNGREVFDKIKKGTLNSFELENLIQTTDDVLASDAPQLLKKDRTAALTTMIKQVAADLYAEGKYNAVVDLFDDLDLIQVNNTRIFRSVEVKKEFSELKGQAIRQVENVINESTVEKRELLKGKLFAVLEANAQSKENMPEARLRALRSAFSMMGVPQERIEGLIDQAFDAPGEFNKNLLTVLNGVATENDLAGSLFYRINKSFSIDMSKIREMGLTPIILNDENKKTILDELRKYQGDNPEEKVPWKGYLAAQGGRVEPFDELINLSEELTAGNYVFDRDYYKNIAKLVTDEFKNIAEALEADVDSEYSQSVSLITPGSVASDSTAHIKNILKQKAFEIANEDPDVREIKLRELAKTALEEEKRLFRALATASAIDLERGETTVPLKGKAKKEAEKKYKSISEDAELKPGELKQEREQMMADGDQQALGISLALYGYDQWDPNSYKALKATSEPKLDAGEVKLFASTQEMNAVTSVWEDIILKEKTDELTQYEIDQRVIYSNLGIYNEKTLEQFRNVQNDNFPNQ